MCMNLYHWIYVLYYTMVVLVVIYIWFVNDRTQRRMHILVNIIKL